MILVVKRYLEDDSTVVGFPNFLCLGDQVCLRQGPQQDRCHKSIESPYDFEITSIIDNFFLKLIYASILLTIPTDSSNQPYFPPYFKDLPKTSFAAYRTRKIPKEGSKWLGVISTRPRQSLARSSGWGSWSQRPMWNQELTVDPNKILLVRWLVIGLVLINWKEGGEEKKMCTKWYMSFYVSWILIAIWKEFPYALKFETQLQGKL